VAAGRGPAVSRVAGSGGKEAGGGGAHATQEGGGFVQPAPAPFSSRVPSDNR
jgi:hypothetical protein